jgi:hypothetical protein
MRSSRPHKLGGSRNSEDLTSEQRLEKLMHSAAFGGKHVPLPVKVPVAKSTGSIRPQARFRSVLELGSRLKNETISTKNKKSYIC